MSSNLKIKNEDKPTGICGQCGGVYLLTSMYYGEICFNCDAQREFERQKLKYENTS